MTSKVERHQLAPGFSISRVLTGLWQIADMERDGKQLDPDATARFMAPYYDAGLTTFDMADHYGSAEIITGVFRRQIETPESVQLFTKWVPKPGRCSRTEVREAVQISLDRMKMDCLDMLQYHAWNYADPAWLDQLFWLQELKDEGLIRHLGVTNFDAAHLRIVATSGIEIVTNQICYSLLDQRARNDMTEVCEAYGIKILAFGTVAGGFLSEKWLGKPEPNALDTWSQMKYKRFIDAAGGWENLQSILQTIHEIAKKHDVSMVNVACRYILDQPSVAGIIIGARLGQSQHIADNLKIFNFEIDAESRGQLDEVLARLDPIPGGCGDEYRKPPFLTASGDLSHHLEHMPTPYEPQNLGDGKSRVLSGTIWEDIAGFSRAVRRGNRILVSGTTATHGSRAIGSNDPAAQMHFIIDKIEGAIQSLGGKLEDVIRTRIYIQNESQWEPISRAHGKRFGDIMPANTMIKATVIGDEYLVEMEAEAVVND